MSNAKRRFGQNFLVDRNVVDRIIAAINPQSDQTIIEIGPGRGALTSLLIEKAKRVVAIEFGERAKKRIEVELLNRLNTIAQNLVIDEWADETEPSQPRGCLFVSKYSSDFTDTRDADADLDTAKWRVAAGDPNGIQLVGNDAAFWLQWTTPDSGFVLQTTTTLAAPNSWADLGWTVPQVGAVKRVLVRAYTTTPEAGKTYAPAPDLSFFRMHKP